MADGENTGGSTGPALQGHASEPLDIVIIEVEEGGGVKLCVHAEDAERVLTHIRTTGFMHADGRRRLLNQLANRYIIVAAEYEDLVMRVLGGIPSGLRTSPVLVAGIRIAVPSNDPVVIDSDEEDVASTQLDEEKDEEAKAAEQPEQSGGSADSRLASRATYPWIISRMFVHIPLVTLSEGQHTVSSGGHSHNVRNVCRRLDDSQSSSQGQSLATPLEHLQL